MMRKYSCVSALTATRQEQQYSLYNNIFQQFVTLVCKMHDALPYVQLRLAKYQNVALH
jgi:hypothetical protein